MPSDTEHAARVRDPNDFKADSFRSKIITTGVRLIIGKLKDDEKGNMTAQSYRFKTANFTAAEAKKWLKDHNIKYIAFEPASGDKNSLREEEDASMYHRKDDVERRCLTLSEIRIEDKGSDPPKIVGYAAVFNTWTDINGWFKEKIKPGAFSKTIKENDVRALVNHNENYVLGRTKAKPKATCRLREDSHGLAVEIDPPDTTWAKDLQESMKRGDISQMSFGFTVNKQESDYEKNERVLVDVTLFDVSVVTFPAYPTTTATVRSLFQRTEVEPMETEIAPIVEEERKETTDNEKALVAICIKICGNEPLTIEEQRVLAQCLPDISISVPVADHTEPVTEPVADHSETAVGVQEEATARKADSSEVPEKINTPAVDRVADLIARADQAAQLYHTNKGANK